MLVATRFRVPAQDAPIVPGRRASGPSALAARPGFQRRNPRPQRRRPHAVGADHPLGERRRYRRALSAYDVKLDAVPLLSRAIDEPVGLRVVEPGADLNIEMPRSLG